MTLRHCPAVLMLLASLCVYGQANREYKLVWSDEFNAAAGTPPNPANWNYDLGGGGWGNGEAQIYTDSIRNAFHDGKGNLVIRAIREAGGKYTSARLQTGGARAGTHTADRNWQYGRIVARMKLPYGKGIWPAFWMLGQSFGTTGWPGCGEIDIMENFGAARNNAAMTTGTLHGPGYSGARSIGKSYTLPSGHNVFDEFHEYAMEWLPDSIEWLMDGTPFFKMTPASLPQGARWVFDRPFFILLNLAIGGPATFLGQPDADAPFEPQDMLIDYVRVYQR